MLRRSYVATRVQASAEPQVEMGFWCLGNPRRCAAEYRVALNIPDADKPDRFCLADRLEWLLPLAAS